MSENTEVRRAVRVPNVLVDAHVEADVSGLMGWARTDTPERLAKALEGAAKDFNDFVRDHRSMDKVSLHVVRVVRDQCSECHQEWETQTEDGVTMCANCGVEVAP